jgi:hypothetical protein
VGESVHDSETTAAGGSFAATAAAGGFAISPDAGQAMTNAIDDALYRLYQAERLFERIREGTPLGDSPAGLRMAQHNLSVAIGDASGERALQDLKDALVEHRAAIEQAVRSYRDTDQHNAGSLG